MMHTHWEPKALLPVHPLSFLGPLLVGTNHCILGPPHHTCCFGDSVSQSNSYHKLALVKVVQILMLVYFTLAPFKNYLFPCCLLYRTLQQVLFLQDDECYSLQWFLMLWLIICKLKSQYWLISVPTVLHYKIQ